MYKRNFTKELQEKAKKKLHETQKRREDDVKHIKDWLLKQPHLNARTDEQWITNFLRGCKFSTQKAKEKLEYLYTTKPLAPEFFSRRDPLLPEMQEILNRNIFLPYASPNDEVLIVRWRNVDANKVSILNLFKVAFMILDISVSDSDTILITGVHIVVDLKGFPMASIKEMTPAFFKKLAYIICKGYALRLNGIYFINCFPYFQTIFNMFKTFLNKKIKSKIKFYYDNEESSFLKDIPNDVLPLEYGGTGDSIVEIGPRWKSIIERFRNWLIDDERYKCDETYRLNNRISSDMFGMEGSFRQLELD
ncbi:hypothetical protein RI129_005589 [Pyrocoelia pectoralis]|uniref:CRAL-TRIO domain-containing protein n=1 Tax=Pyrocoelia pectoralis TaxID=417401 RepID=A0AAN7VEI4_9COLE